MFACSVKRESMAIRRCTMQRMQLTIMRHCTLLKLLW